MVALLRSINVGGGGRLAMADLRAVAESCGHRDVRTYIQSGNVVFRATETRTASVANTLRDALREQVGIDTSVFVRTRDELAAVVAANPLADRAPDPTRLHVVFTDAPAGPALADLDLAAFAPEEAVAEGRQLFLHLPGGIGRSPLAVAVARRLGDGGTTRNWRTTTTLAGWLDELNARS